MSEAPLSSDLLKLEETLLILEELLVNDQKHVRQHIQRLKVFYSPLFDFDHSESGSYFYAAIKSLCHYYLAFDTTSVILSERCQTSLTLLEKVSLLSLDRRKNHTTLVSELLTLASLWQLEHSLDVSDMLRHVLAAMRYDAMRSNNPNYVSQS